jgi:hypothetical protein
MKTTYTDHWIDLAALAQEDDDAELRAFVSVDLEEIDEAARHKLANRRTAASTWDAAARDDLPPAAFFNSDFRA